MLSPSDIRDILERHDTYFNARRDKMREYRRLYLTEFWSDETLDGILRTEVPKAYAVVESYLRKVGGSCNHWQPRAVSMATDKPPPN